MAHLVVDYYADALGVQTRMHVLLPQRQTAGKVKTLYLLHGMTDDCTLWQRRTSIERYAAPLGLAVVMPNAHLSSYADMAHGGKYYTYISQELPEKMRAMFPLSDKREDNFIAGLSMGGAGCMKIGLNNPQNYAAIGCLSAGAVNRDGIAMTPERRARMIMTYGTEDVSPRKGTPEDVFGAAQRILGENLPRPRIFHSVGTEDFVLPSARETRDFFQGLAGNPFDYTYEEHPGAHTWEFWDEHVQHFLKYLNLTKTEGVRN